MIKATDKNLSNAEYRFLKMLEEDDSSEWMFKDLVEIWSVHEATLRNFVDRLCKKGYIEKYKAIAHLNGYRLP